VVLQIGHHYAFSFFDDAVEKHQVEYGQLSVLKDKYGCNLIETELMMIDAREIGVQVVCSWFEEDEATGILKLGLVHPPAATPRGAASVTSTWSWWTPKRRPTGSSTRRDGRS
jgi:hypothetical protein